MCQYANDGDNIVRVCLMLKLVNYSFIAPKDNALVLKSVERYVLQYVLLDITLKLWWLKVCDFECNERARSRSHFEFYDLLTLGNKLNRHQKLIIRIKFQIWDLKTFNLAEGCRGCGEISPQNCTLYSSRYF